MFFFGFSAFFYIRLKALDFSDKFSLSDFFIRVYKGDIIVPYWYIYAYISFLLSFPILRAIVKNLPKTIYQYLIILYIIFISILPCIEYRLSQGDVTLNKDGNIYWMFTNIVIFPIIGYYLENVLDFSKIKIKHLISFCIFSFIGIIISCYMTYFKHAITGTCTEAQTQDFFNSFMLPLAITIYLCSKYFCSNVKIYDLAKKILLSVGNCTFGIYLIHIAIIESSFITSLYSILTKLIHINYMFSILLICLITMIISYFITRILKEVPGIGKLL